MKKYLFLFFVNILFSNHTIAQNYFDISTLKKTGLTLVEINTNDGVMPTCDYADAPEGSMGSTCINQTKVPCRIIISLKDDIYYDSGEYSKGVSGATIKINGNTSSFHDNKPYKIKLQTKADLLNRNNEKYKDKNWRLLKDARTLKTIIGLKINELLGLPWTPAYRPCNVFINNEYQGCYLLIESVERNSDCRLDVDKSSGYIIERDPYWWKENTFFSTQYFEPYKGYRWTWKYPDEEDVTEENELYINNYIVSMEESLQQGNYEDYIDISSFTKWILSHDILGTRDSWGSNMYIKKFDESNQSRLELPCLWDFDSSYEITPGTFSKLHIESNEYFYALMNSSNPSFRNAYVKLWKEKKEEITNTLTAFLNEFEDTEEAKAIDISRKLYNNRWGYYYGTVKSDVQHTLKWINSHFPLLDQQIQSIETNISEINYSHDDKYKQYYNIQGMKINTIKNNSIIICRDSNGKTTKFIKNR